MQSNIPILTNATQNGKTEILDKEQTNAPKFSDDSICCVYADTTEAVEWETDIEFPTSAWTQFRVLLGRMFMQMRRNKPMLWIQLLHHVLSGLIVGSIFFGIGDDAAHMLANFKYCMSVLAFFMYTYVMVPVLICK